MATNGTQLEPCNTPDTKEHYTKYDAYCKACIVRYTTASTEKADYLQQLIGSDPLSTYSCKHDYLIKEHKTPLTPLTMKTMLPVVTVSPNSAGCLVSVPSQCCYLCGGLLQPYTIVHTVNTILSSIKSGEYVPTSFIMSCTSPVHFHVRAHTSGLGKPRLSVKNVFKWLLVEALEKTLGLPSEGESKESTGLQIQVEVKMDEAELAFLRQFNPNIYHSKTGKYRTPLILDYLEKSKHDLKQYVVEPGTNFKLNIALVNSPVYLGGRYTKHSRHISQTPWLVEDDVQRVVTSVETVIGGPVQQALHADEVKLHASGREDIDVRMLGTGRPFYLQIVNGRRIPTQAELDVIQAGINTSDQKVKCTGLTVVSNSQCDKVKNAEVDKTKDYRCIIKTTVPITPEMITTLNSISNLVLKQNTPLRVLHRRAPLIRDKTIHSVKAEQLTLAQVQHTLSYMKVELSEGEVLDLAKHLLVARVQSEAGTYIKEFVHGDFARTLPNVGTLLGCKADLLQLDVERVALEWPPVEQMEIES